MLVRNLTAALTLVIWSATPGQEPISDGITSVLGGGPRVAWFEKSGTVWVTDGTRSGTRDTSVATGRYSQPGDRLIVYSQTSIDILDADGSHTTLTPPIPTAMIDEDAREPTIWRPVLSTRDSEVIEVWRWRPRGWTRELSGVQAALNGWPEIQARLNRPGRFLVVYDEGGWSGNYTTNVVDLLSTPHQHWWITEIDTYFPTVRPWSVGVAFDRTGYNFASGISWIPDGGDGGDVEFPAHWQRDDWSLREVTAGFPFAAWNSGPELITFTRSDVAPIPVPDGQLRSLFWMGANQTVLAHVDRAVGSPLLWFDRTRNAWATVAGVTSAAAVHSIGPDLLAISDSTGTAIARFDATRHAVDLLAAGLVGVQGGQHAFAGGWLFTADDGHHGMQPWWTDGTAASTRMQADLSGTGAHSTPRGWVNAGMHVVFAAGNGPTLRLWSIAPQHLEWIRSPVNGHFYRRSAPSGWFDAQRAARNAGGHLATVHSRAEQDWLWATFGPHNLWIGLEDLDGDGVFSWTSGEPLTFTNWCPGEPNRSTPTESVVHLANYPGFCLGGWNDQEPTDRYPGIIERSGPPLAVEPFGEGCRAAPVQPVAELTWQRGSPDPGSTVELLFVFGTGLDLRGFALLGLDSTRFAGLSLPFDLASVGAPGCRLHVAVDDVIDLGTIVYARPWSLAIPPDPALAGARLFVQGLGIDFGILQPTRSTNALRVTIGGP